MRYQQRDVVEVNFLFPDGSTKPHMAILVSNNQLQEDEDFFYLVMISSKNYNPQYTYVLDNEMLSFALSKKSFVVCQLLSGYTERDVVRKLGQIKNSFFQEIVEKIKQSIF
ncbi:MAG: type II toxin-antitoxin system PemK/MazF family toxin [Bacteroidales bacterium]